MATQHSKYLDEKDDSPMCPDEICEKLKLIHTYTGMISRHRNMSGRIILRKKSGRTIHRIWTTPYEEIQKLMNRIEEADKDRKREIALQHMFPEHNL